MLKQFLVNTNVKRCQTMHWINTYKFTKVQKSISNNPKIEGCRISKKKTINECMYVYSVRFQCVCDPQWEWNFPAFYDNIVLVCHASTSTVNQWWGFQLQMLMYFTLHNYCYTKLEQIKYEQKRQRNKME